MIKTLKITSILIALAAVGFIVFIAAHGVSADTDIEAFLDNPGVAEQLQKEYAGKKSPKQDRQTPLIRQSANFALRIDPPPPPAPITARATSRPTSRSSVSRPKAAVSAKFKLVGTSYHDGDKDNSWALLSEVGKGLHWVKLKDTVGHLQIVKIGDGVIRILDGQKTYELVAERKQKPDYVVSYSGKAEQRSDLWKPTEDSRTEIVAVTPAAEPAQPPVDIEVTKETIQSNIEWLTQLQKNPESLGMTAAEAKEMEGLGKMLEDLQGQLKEADSNAAEKKDAPPQADRSALDAFLKQVTEQEKPSKLPREANEAMRRRKR